MNKLEELAVELALLTQGDVQTLATILVRNYAARADILETAIGNSFFETTEALND
jgi:hypothetical protein